MDQLIRQFIEKTPVHLLDQHRRHMRNVTYFLCHSLVKAVLAAQNAYHQSGNSSSEDCIITGSMAEGATLARLFSPDINTSSETEYDIMMPLAEWHAEEGLTYIDNNNAFIHIVANSDVSTQLRSFYGKDAEQKIFCQKEDGIYISNQVGQLEFKEFLEQSPNAFSSWGFRPCVANKRCEAGNAAMTVEIDGVVADGDVADQSLTCGSETTSSAMGFASREAQISASANDRCLNLVKEIMPCCEQFNIRIAKMLLRLQKVQDEFMEMRSAELSMSIHGQASKALEWAMTCLDITDVIFDTKQSTVCRLMSSSLGTNVGTTIEEQREELRGKLKTYIDQLAISEDDLVDVSVAAAVSQLLSDIERADVAPKRFLVVFQEHAREMASFSERMTYVIRNPQLGQIPEPLQQLSAILKRVSFDFVPCFKLMFWPRVAAEWKTRDRVWPHQLVTDDIVGKGAHLVAKEFCHDDIDWRLSFSVAEIDLATRWSPVQHFVYFIFKSLFYKFIKPLYGNIVGDISGNLSNKKYLASYTAKTVMMWTSESVDQSWWTEDNAAECLTVLLLALQSAFECHTLDHYFVPSVNLLEGLPDDLASRVIDAINSILSDPAAVVYQLESHFVNIDIFFNAMPAQIEFQKHIADIIKLISLS